MAKKTVYKVPVADWVKILVATMEAFSNMPDGTVITFSRADLKMLTNFKHAVLAYHRDWDYTIPIVNQITRILDRLQGERLQFIVSLGPVKPEENPGGKK